MKSVLISVMMLFVFAASQAQFKGVPFGKAIPIMDLMERVYRDDLFYNTLVKYDRDSLVAYVYFYEVNAKGYHDALKELNRILEANSIRRAPDEDDSFFESHIDEGNYNDVALELRLESGWIDRSWYLYDDKWGILMKCNDEVIRLGVVKYKY